MKERTRKGLYVASHLLGKAAVFAGKVGVTLFALALIPSIIQDVEEKKRRKARRNNDNNNN